MAVEERLVAIIGRHGKPVGAGLLINDDLVLTCAHVVSDAIGDSSRTRPSPDVEVSVRVHGSRGVVKATIDPADDGWRPPPASKNGGDLCILQLPPGTAKGRGPALLREYAMTYGVRFYTAGYPKGWSVDKAEGRILGIDDGLLMLASEARGSDAAGIFEDRPAGVIYRGFSGGPVESGDEIIGLLTLARVPKDATAYMMPVSSFGKRFETQIRRSASRVSDLYSHVTPLMKEARKRIGHVPRFDVRLRYCADFTEALDVHRNSAADRDHPSGEVEEYGDGRDLRTIDLALKLRSSSQLILLHAPGGSGKSEFLHALMLAAPDAKLVPFLLDFSQGGKGLDEQASDDAVAELKNWFRRYKAAFGDPAQLLKLSAEPRENLKPLLIIDGLNQVAVRWAEVLTNLAKLSRQELSGASIIVADRMIDRESATEGFDHAVMLPMVPTAWRVVLAGKKQIAAVDQPAWRPILSSPMFLNLYLTAPQTGKSARPVLPSRFHILNSYFRSECKFSSEELRVLADFAFETYRENRQTAIPKETLGKFYENDGRRLQRRIADKGLLHPIGTGAEFRHQLLHDALAALKVASATESEEEALLRGPAFDVLSLNSASPDAIELAMEATQYPGELLAERKHPLEPREFLSAVFDWNYWITLQCVASFDRRGDSPLPEWMRHAVYGHNLERRFDPFLHTAWRAEQMKALIPDPEKLTYFDAGSRDEMTEKITKIVQQISGTSESENDYQLQWLEVYSRKSFTPADLVPLWCDPFLSWTAANVIRRSKNREQVTGDLLRMYEISRRTSDSAFKSASFRWRLVHALGRGTTAALEPLLAATLDPLESADVRYGAVRSLIELAVTGAGAQQRDEILKKLHAGLKRLFEGLNAGRVRKELRRACAFNEVHVDGRDGWREDWLSGGLQKFIAILRCGQELAKEEQEAVLWSEWAATASSVPTAVGEWEQRKAKWLPIIGKDL